MAAAPEPKQPRSKSANRRARLRAQGLRPIELWVPDVNSPAFRSEAHRQSAAIAASEGEGEDQGFIDSLSTFDDE